MLLAGHTETKHYATALLASAAAVAFRGALQPVLGESGPFAFFFPAVLLSSWLGGFGPGLFATALGLLSGLYFFTPPYFTFAPLTVRTLTNVSLFTLVSAIIAWMGGRLRAANMATAAALEREQEQRARAELGQAQAETASRLKDEFLATVSHELRTPLNSILGWARILGSGAVDDSIARRGLETIDRNARSQAQLIEDLLDVSRIVSGKMRLSVGPVDPAGVIRAAVESVRPAADAKGIQLQLDFDTDAGPLRGDPERLQQVVWNLVSNATKFTPKGGSVRVRLGRVGSHLEISVSDTGEGIPPEFLPYVFDRFRQADSSMTRKHGGLGLGLSIVRHLVELHGGTVHAESPGQEQGATFRILLPLAGARTEAPTPQPPAEPLPFDPAATLARLRVIVVDDEGDSRALLEFLLTSWGAEVRGAASLQEAIDVMTVWEPDVLLSDVGMPNGDGYELIRAVRQLESDRARAVPAVAVTAYARPEDRIRLLSAGYQSYLAKPVDPAELRAVVASLTGRHS